MINTMKNDEKDSISTYIADTFSKRLTGYMFRREPHYEAILLNPCNSIHTFFMKFNIDVLFVDENMIIVKKIEDLKPWRLVMPVKCAKIVIESKAGALSNFQEGSTVYCD